VAKQRLIQLLYEIAYFMKSHRRMSALGKKRTFRNVQWMSALPPKADIGADDRDVCFVPKADISRLIRIPRRELTICGGLASKTTRSGQREPKIMCQHSERHRDDENGYWQR
jgi:hypothetical protein